MKASKSISSSMHQMLKLHMLAWKAHNLTAIAFLGTPIDVQGANQDKPRSQSVGKERVTIQCFISIVSTGNYRTHIKPSLRGFKKIPQYFKRVVIEGIEVWE